MTVEAANHTKSTQLIYQSQKITIATATYPKNNWAVFILEEFLTKDIVSTEDICFRNIFFSEVEMIMINW